MLEHDENVGLLQNEAMEAQLTQLVNRLEAVTARLESVAWQKGTPVTSASGQDTGE